MPLTVSILRMVDVYSLQCRRPFSLEQICCSNLRVLKVVSLTGCAVGNRTADCNTVCHKLLGFCTMDIQQQKKKSIFFCLRAWIVNYPFELLGILFAIL